MNNFIFVSPEECVEKRLTYQGDEKSLKFWEKLSRKKARKCEVCETEDRWKMAGVDLCFTCTTGEADASNDYEIE